MSYEACDNCGGRIYEYGCVNCNEAEYIENQEFYELDKAPEGATCQDRESAL